MARPLISEEIKKQLVQNELLLKVYCYRIKNVKFDLRLC